MSKTLYEIRLIMGSLNADFLIASQPCMFRDGSTGCKHRDNHVDFALGALCGIGDCPIVHHESFMETPKREDKKPRCICDWIPSYSIYCSIHKDSQGG